VVQSSDWDTTLGEVAQYIVVLVVSIWTVAVAMPCIIYCLLDSNKCTKRRLAFLFVIESVTVILWLASFVSGIWSLAVVPGVPAFMIVMFVFVIIIW
jgi:hypothetical protein